MAGVLTLAGRLFQWVRWLGVAHLVYIEIQARRAPAVDPTQVVPESTSSRSIFLRGFLVSLTNPETLLFYGAFFPLFLKPELNLLGQLVLLSATFLTIAIALDLLLGAGGQSATPTARHSWIAREPTDGQLLPRCRCRAGEVQTK